MNLTSNITTSNASKMIRLHTLLLTIIRIRISKVVIDTFWNNNTANSTTIICETNIIFNIITVMLANNEGNVCYKQMCV